MPKVRLPRLSGWALIALMLVAVTALAEPTRLSSVAAKLANIALGGVLGYWFDRSVFYYDRPDSYITGGACAPLCDALFIGACRRRAMIIGAFALAMALGV